MELRTGLRLHNAVRNKKDRQHCEIRRVSTSPVFSKLTLEGTLKNLRCSFGNKSFTHSSKSKRRMHVTGGVSHEEVAVRWLRRTHQAVSDVQVFSL